LINVTPFSLDDELVYMKSVSGYASSHLAGVRILLYKPVNSIPCLCSRRSILTNLNKVQWNMLAEKRI